MRNVPLRTASLCVAFILLGNPSARAQNGEPTPQEEERALEALRAGLDETPPEPNPFDPHSARTWEVAPAADIAPGLYTNLFRPSAELLSATADGDWLPGSGMSDPQENPHEDRAATASAPSGGNIGEPPSNLATPPSPPKKSGKNRAARKTHSTLRSGRASLDAKSPEKPKAKPRPKTERAAPKAPAVALPGELRP